LTATTFPEAEKAARSNLVFAEAKKKKRQKNKKLTK
jgi:hypothetical protein